MTSTGRSASASSRLIVAGHHATDPAVGPSACRRATALKNV
jgi:hypothetical protein